MAGKPKPHSETGVFVAVSSGVFRIRGRIHRYHAGQTLPADSPLIALRPSSFRAVEFGERTTPTERQEA